MDWLWGLKKEESRMAPGLSLIETRYQVMMVIKVGNKGPISGGQQEIMLTLNMLGASEKSFM